MSTVHNTLFGAEWETAMEQAHEAFIAHATIAQQARSIMEQSMESATTQAALDAMNEAAAKAHDTWVKANPIRWARTHSNKKLVVNDIAPAIGLSVPALFAWEHGGVSTPDSEAMQKLANLLGVPNLSDLWYRWRNLRTRE